MFSFVKANHHNILLSYSFNKLKECST